MENLFVTRGSSACPSQHAYQCECLPQHPPGSPATLPWPPTRCSLFLQAGELETLKQSSRLRHCATALLFDPAAWMRRAPRDSWGPRGTGEAPDSWICSETSVPSPLIVVASG